MSDDERVEQDEQSTTIDEVPVVETASIEDDSSKPGDEDTLRKRKTIHVEEEPASTSLPTQPSITKPPTGPTNFTQRIHHVRNAVTNRVAEYGRNPSQIVPLIKTQIDRNPHKLLTIFFIIWLPFVIMLSGSLSGQLVRLFFRNFHYFVGVVSAVAVWFLQSRYDKLPAPQRFLFIFLISSVVPILMVEDNSFLLKVFTLIAFAGAPLLYAKLVEETGTIRDANINNEEILLLYSTAPSVIFVLAAGGFSYTHHIILCIVFALAAFVAQRALPIILTKIPEPQRPLINPHQPLVFAVLELLLANIISFILGFIIVPQSVIDEQHGFLANLLITIIGLAFLGLAHVLSTGFLQTKGIPAAQVGLAEKAYLGLLGVSYGAILLTHAISHWFLSHVSQPTLLDEYVN